MLFTRFIFYVHINVHTSHWVFTIDEPSFLYSICSVCAHLIDIFRCFMILIDDIALCVQNKVISCNLFMYILENQIKEWSRVHINVRNKGSRLCVSWRIRPRELREMSKHNPNKYYTKIQMQDMNTRMIITPLLVRIRGWTLYG